MALLIICRGLGPERYDRAVRKLAPDYDVRLWPDNGPKKDIRYVLAWNPPKGELATYPNLQVIFSAGAGVEHLPCDPFLPDCPIVRLVTQTSPCA